MTDTEEAASSLPSEEEQARLVAEFVQRTGTDEATASSFLEAHDYSVEDSVADYTSQLEEEEEEEQKEEEKEEEKEREKVEEKVEEKEVAAVVAEIEPVPATQEKARNLVPEAEAATAAAPEVAEAENLVPEAATTSVDGEQDADANAAPSGGVAEPQRGSTMEEVLYDVELTADEDDTFKQVDEVAQRIGKEVGAIAVDAAAEAKEYVASVTQSMASLAANPNLEDFGKSLSRLDKNENLIEQFPCKLLQTYSCAHNQHTPDIQMAFQGTLFITDRHTCFNVEENERRLPIVLPHKSVTRVERHRPTRRSEKNDVLKMSLAENEWISMKDFASGHLDSALALLEHLCESPEA